MASITIPEEIDSTMQSSLLMLLNDFAKVLTQKDEGEVTMSDLHDENINDLKAEITANIDEIEELNEAVSTLENQVSSLEGALQEIEES